MKKELNIVATTNLKWIKNLLIFLLTILSIVGCIFFERKVSLLDYATTSKQTIAVIIGFLVYMYTIFFLLGSIAVISLYFNKDESSTLTLKKCIFTFLSFIVAATIIQLLFWSILLSKGNYFTILILTAVFCFFFYFIFSIQWKWE